MAEAQALVKAESGAHPSGKQEAHVKVAAPASRKHRKPLPLGKIVAALVVLLVIAVAALPYFWPMQDVVRKVETDLSAQLQQKVHIGTMKAALLPLPKVELQDVSVGSAQELKAGSVVLNLGLSALFSDVKTISKAEISNLVLSAGSFDKALGWLHAAASNPKHPMAQAVLQQVRIDGEIKLPLVSGKTEMDAQGRIAKVMLSSEDGKLSVELKPQQSRWQVALSVREGSLPLLPDIKFTEFNAKGETGENEINFSEMDGRLYGGMMQGNAKLSWHKGWKLEGRANIKMLELQKALSQFGVSGEMEGNANFILRAERLAQLADTAGVEGSYLVKKGIINDIDVVETAASGRQGAAGGRTHFDEMTGLLQVDGSGQHLRQIRMISGAFVATGSADISSGRQLSGKLSVDLKMRAGQGSLPLVLSGTADKPALRIGR